MSKLKTLLILLLFGCSTTDKYDLFKIKSSDKNEFLNLEEIDGIEIFNTRFWKRDSIDSKFSFVAKFDFEREKFSDNSDKGINLEGLPFLCLEFDCKPRTLKLFLGDNYEIFDDQQQLINEMQIKVLIKNNILNYGKIPYLSEEPEEAVTEIYLKSEHKLSKLEHIISIIADSYLDMIESKRIELHLSTEQLVKQFPLVIRLRQNMISEISQPPINLPNDQEIEEELLLDSVAINQKPN